MASWPRNSVLFPPGQWDEKPSRIVQRKAVSSDQTPKLGANDEVIGLFSLFYFNLLSADIEELAFLISESD